MTSFSIFLLLLAYSQLSTAAAIQGDAVSWELVERAGCGNPKLASDLSACYTYCDTTETQLFGSKVAVSDVINCDVPSCSAAYSHSVSISESFTVSSGFSTGPITASTTFTWEKTVTSGDSYVFTLGKGDLGYIEWLPWLNKVCGTLTSYAVDSSSLGDTCTTTKTATDPNACGTSGVLLSNGIGNGTYTFCYTNGTGCNPFQLEGDKMVLV